jgi:hypothetical protein
MSDCRPGVVTCSTEIANVIELENRMGFPDRSASENHHQALDNAPIRSTTAGKAGARLATFLGTN